MHSNTKMCTDTPSALA